MDDFERYVKSLPKPLTKAEQKQLLLEYKMTRSEEIRNELIEHNLLLVAHVVKNYYGQRINIDDLMQIGTLGLIRAIERYDDSKGVLFTTYAYAAIKGKIINELNNKNRVMDAMWQEWNSVMAKGKSQEEKVVDVFDFVYDKEDDFVKNYAEREFFLNFLSDQGLSELDKFILINQLGLFGNTILNPDVIAAKFNVTEYAVEKRIRELLNQLRNYYITSGHSRVDEKLKAIAHYANTTSNTYHKVILEYAYGLNGKQVLKHKEIAELLGVTPGSISQALGKARAKAGVIDDKNGVTAEVIEKYLDVFGTDKERLVANYYYSFKGAERLGPKAISDKTGIKIDSVYAILQRLKRKVERQKLHAKDCTQLEFEDIDDFYKNKAAKVEKFIIEKHFGFYGNEKMSRAEIAQVLGCSTNALSYRIVRLLAKIEDYKVVKMAEDEILS